MSNMKLDGGIVKIGSDYHKNDYSGKGYEKKQEIMMHL